MEEPLLFIPSPPFYYIEVEETTDEKLVLDESTSVFEIQRSSSSWIEDSIIARQLHYFFQPANRNSRILSFHLKNGEIIKGKLENLIGVNVIVNSSNQTVTIDGNDIDTIALA